MTLNVIVFPDKGVVPDLRVAVRVVGPSAGGSWMMGLGSTVRVRVVGETPPTVTVITADWSAILLSRK